MVYKGQEQATPEKAAATALQARAGMVPAQRVVKVTQWLVTLQALTAFLQKLLAAAAVEHGRLRAHDG